MKFTNPQLVTFAIGELGGNTQYIDREDIAVKVNELAPGRFTWRKYPSQIDLEAVAVALRDAKKFKNGGLVTGDSTVGWMLSAAGIHWIQSLNKSLAASEIGEAVRRGSIGAELQMERSRLEGTKAYRLFVEGRLEDITVSDLYEFLRVNEYFPSKARQRRIQIVENAVVGDEALSNLWLGLKRMYPGEIQ